jgi:hypothetical protein
MRDITHRFARPSGTYREAIIASMSLLKIYWLRLIATSHPNSMYMGICPAWLRVLRPLRRNKPSQCNWSSQACSDKPTWKIWSGSTYLKFIFELAQRVDLSPRANLNATDAQSLTGVGRFASRRATQLGCYPVLQGVTQSVSAAGLRRLCAGAMLKARSQTKFKLLT